MCVRDMWVNDLPSIPMFLGMIFLLTHLQSPSAQLLLLLHGGQPAHRLVFHQAQGGICWGLQVEVTCSEGFVHYLGAEVWLVPCSLYIQENTELIHRVGPRVNTWVMGPALQHPAVSACWLSLHLKGTKRTVWVEWDRERGGELCFSLVSMLKWQDRWIAEDYMWCRWEKLSKKQH